MFLISFASTTIVHGAYVGLERLQGGRTRTFSDFQYCSLFVVDSSLIDADLSNFPLLVYLNSSRIDWTHVQDDLDDIRFSVNNTTFLDYEIDTFTVNTEAWFWIRIPFLSSSLDTNLYVYYGDVSATSGENPTAVWDSDYITVHHMNDETTSLILDSANVYNGTKIGANEPIEVTGLIGNAQSGDGINDRIDINQTSGVVWDSFSLEILFNFNAPLSDPTVNGRRFAGTYFPTYYGAMGSVQPTTTSLAHITHTSGTINYVDISNAGDGWLFAGAKCENTTFSSLVVWNSTEYIGFDSDLTSYYVETPSETWGGYGLVGTRAGGYSYCNVTVGEMRLSNIIRSDVWLNTTALSMYDRLLTYGAETEPPNYSQFITIENASPNFRCDLYNATNLVDSVQADIYGLIVLELPLSYRFDSFEALYTIYDRVGDPLFNQTISSTQGGDLLSMYQFTELSTSDQYIIFGLCLVCITLGIIGFFIPFVSLIGVFLGLFVLLPSGINFTSLPYFLALELGTILINIVLFILGVARRLKS